jgi:peptide/nickel transport system substrate-binding protein
VITKVPYDPRRAEQYLAEAGYAKGGDGFYMHPTDGRLMISLQYQAGPQFEKEAAIIGDNLKQIGVEYTSHAQTDAMRNQVEYQVAYPSLRSLGGGTIDSMYGSRRVPTAENRFSGSNRGSWINAEYDRLLDAFTVTLDRSQRSQQLIDMAKVVSENLPAFSLYYNMAALARPPELHGVPLGSNIGASWNVYQWEFK